VAQTHTLAKAGIRGEDLDKVVAALERAVPKPTGEDSKHSGYSHGTPIIALRALARIYGRGGDGVLTPPPDAEAGSGP
jgi:hypothetical protein